MDDLSGARLKVERAKKHISDLEAERARFLDSNPYAVTPEFYPEHDSTVLYVDKFTDVPENIVLIAGDAIHNLRSSLDHLACALVRRNGGNTKRTYFPICETAEKYRSEGIRKINGISVADEEAITALKPYGGGNESLLALHRLDILDKHDILITAACAVGKIGYPVSTASLNKQFKGFARFGPGLVRPHTAWIEAKNRFIAAKKGDPILAIAGDHESDHQIQISFDVALAEEGIFYARPLLEVLNSLVEEVSRVIAGFDRAGH